jgi:hypothetical protein
VYAGIVAGRQLSGVKAGIDSSSTLPTKNGDPGECKGVRELKSSRRTPTETKSPRGEKDVTVSTTVGEHLITHPTAYNMPSGPPKLTVKCTVPVESESRYG